MAFNAVVDAGDAGVVLEEECLWALNADACVCVVG